MLNRHTFGAILIALFSILILISCQKDDPTIVITSVEIDETVLEDIYDLSDFELSDIKIIVTYSDDSTESITVTQAMLSSSDIDKLSWMGTHELVINYLDYQLNLSIELTSASMLALLQAQYQVAVNTLGFNGNYEAWIDEIVKNDALNIIFVELNQQNELIITLSNFETITLVNEQQPDTFTVSFFGKDGILLDTQVVQSGASASAPIPPIVSNYNFIGWDASFDHITSDISVHAIYQYTGTPLATVENADELLISLNRLENAQFEVDLDTIFSQASSEQSVKKSRSLSYFYDPNRLLSMGESIDPTSYIPHNYWNHMYYYEGLFTQPEVIDGYHVITSSLTSMSSHALNNLYEVNIQVTSHARDKADWAVDFITVVDTWVTTDNYQYLLHYNDEIDRVELYTIIDIYGDGKVMSYEKIYVYYNNLGEEVVESWVNQIYTDEEMPGYPGVLGYHNAINGRDFNYYAIWLDESYQPTDMHHYRGINLSEDGYFEYYDNSYLMIEGEYGWYTVQPNIDMLNETIWYSETPYITLFSKDATTDVMTIYPSYDGTYKVKLMSPAFSGFEAFLVEEGGMIETNMDSLQTQAFLIGEGFEIMPNWWQMNTQSMEIASGFRTSQGTYFADGPLYQKDIELQSFYVLIGSEGTRMYDMYHNYYAELTYYVNATSIDELVSMMTTYLDEIGLTYKFGDTIGLFEELGYFLENYEAIGDDASIMNAVMEGPLNNFMDYETYLSSVLYITNYLSIMDTLMGMDSNLPHMDMNELPSKDDLNQISLINTTNQVTGTLSYQNKKIVTTGIIGTLSQSPLLQLNASYSLFYALNIGGKLIEVGHESPLVFTGTDLTFVGDLELDLPSQLAFGNYTLVVYFAKITENGTIRVSSVTPWAFNTFDSDLKQEIDVNLETAIMTEITHVNNNMNISVYFEDIFAPKIKYNDATFYQDEGLIDEVIMPFDSTVSDLLDRFIVLDNVDGAMEIDVSMITKDGNPCELTDLLTSSIYVFTATDSSGNQTIITMNTISFGYKVTYMFADHVYFEYMVKANETITPLSNPEQEGYTFIEWNTQNYLITENRIIEAIYTVNNYSITWMYDGQVHQFDESVPFGQTFVTPEMPLVEGYSFVWYIPGETMPAADITVYGEYVKNVYFITFYLDGEFYDQRGFEFGEEIDYPIPEMEDGFTFSGWDIELTYMPADHLTAEGTSIPNQPS